MYVRSDGPDLVVACLIARALYLLGVPVDWLAEMEGLSGSVLVRELGGPYAIGRVYDLAQAVQDIRAGTRTWGSALAQAEEEYLKQSN